MALRKNAIIAALSGIGLVAGTLLLTPAYANPDYPTAFLVAVPVFYRIFHITRLCFKSTNDYG